MKNELVVGEEIVFLYGNHIFAGKVLKINKKTVKIESYAQRGFVSFQKNVDPLRVASKKDNFCVVWVSDVGVEGSYRLEYDKYQHRHAAWNEWLQPWNYVIEKDGQYYR